MKVIGAGFGRTGTLSLKTALEQLGFGKCHHMVEVVDDEHQKAEWNAIAGGAKPNWDSIFSGFESCVDFPASLFYRELVAQYPEAKVVLTVRDPDTWYASARDSIFQYHLGRRDGVFDPETSGGVMSDALIWNGLFEGKFEDAAFAKAKLLERTEEVRREVPKEKLLEFHPRDGWVPLCEFLGVPVPDCPFPHVNEREDMQAVLARKREQQRKT